MVLSFGLCSYKQNEPSRVARLFKWLLCKPIEDLVRHIPLKNVLVRQRLNSNCVFSPLYKDIQRRMARLRLYGGLKLLFCERNCIKYQNPSYHCRKSECVCERSHQSI
jgi:hypothetical protein